MAWDMPDEDLNKKAKKVEPNEEFELIDDLRGAALDMTQSVI